MSLALAALVLVTLVLLAPCLVVLRLIVPCLVVLGLAMLGPAMLGLAWPAERLGGGGPHPVQPDAVQPDDGRRRGARSGRHDS